MEQYFRYGEKEILYLKNRDRRMAWVIDTIGHIRRKVMPDLFEALVHSIAGQQISAKAHETVWRRMQEHIGKITPEHIVTFSRQELKDVGLSFRKVDYILNAAQKVLSGEIDLDGLHALSDAEICRILTGLEGIGTWSAEMLMLFSMQRPDILSFGDLGIQRGLRMIYGHPRIDRKLFEEYRKRFSPYCSIASLYIWAVAGGVIPEMKDPILSTTNNPERSGNAHGCCQHIRIERMTPSEYQDGGKSLKINYSFQASPFGEVLIASTTKGICRLEFPFSREESLRNLVSGYPNAQFQAQTDSLQLNAMSMFFPGKQCPGQVILHLKGTDFQIKIWKQLLNIPFGRLTTYGEIAAATGNPKACRAAGTAIGDNPVAFIVPCHRVIRASGETGNYHWGKELKTAIIKWESEIVRHK